MFSGRPPDGLPNLDSLKQGLDMQDLAAKFLSGEERQRILETVKAAEKHTAGEIVPMVVSVSDHYPMANVIGAAAFALPLALVLTDLLGSAFWIGGQNMWLFLGLFTVLFAVFHAVVARLPRLKRWFVSQREIDEEVEEAAFKSFYGEGLHRTREETGVLIFISVFERKVFVLADRGIDARVDKNCWQEIVQQIAAGIRRHRQAAAICEAVQRVGERLREHFPINADDTDELRNLIIKDPSAE